MRRFLSWYAKRSWYSKVGVVIVGGAAGVALGVVAAPALGAALSAAGLGVAGGTLSGAAASSAGLAALGGGSFAAGGLGVAGGTAVVAAAAGTTVATGTAVASRQASKAGAGMNARRATAEATDAGTDIAFDGEEV